MSESKLARVHLIVRTPQGATGRVNVAQLEKRISEAVRTWQDQLKEELVERFGEEEGLRLFKRHCNSFPAAFIEDVSPGRPPSTSSASKPCARSPRSSG